MCISVCVQASVTSVFLDAMIRSKRVTTDGSGKIGRIIPACFEHIAGAGINGNRSPGSQTSRGQVSVKGPFRSPHLLRATGVLLSIHCGTLTISLAAKAGEAIAGVHSGSGGGGRRGGHWRGC